MEEHSQNILLLPRKTTNTSEIMNSKHQVEKLNKTEPDAAFEDTGASVRRLKKGLYSGRMNRYFLLCDKVSRLNRTATTSIACDKSKERIAHANYENGNYQTSYDIFMDLIRSCLENHDDDFRQSCTFNDKEKDDDYCISTLRIHSKEKEQLSCKGQTSNTNDESRVAITDNSSNINNNESWHPSPSTYIFQRENYDEGMNVFMKTEQTGMEDISLLPIHIVLAILLYNAGQSKNRMEDYQNAYECYEQALITILHHSSKMSSGNNITEGKYTTTANNPVHSIIIKILHNVGRLRYYRQYNLQEAITAYTKALAYSRSIYGDEHMTTALTLNCLGVLYYHIENPNQAYTYLSESHYIKRKLLEPDHVEIATTLVNLGRLYDFGDKKDITKALTYYERARQIRKDKLGCDSVDYADTGLVIADIMQQQGEYDRAIQLYEEFVRVARLKLSKKCPHNRDIADAIFSIGQIYYERCEYSKAYKLFEESIDIKKKSLGNNEYHIEISCQLNWLGNTQFAQSNFDEALNTYYNALRIEKHILQPTHRNIIVELINIGGVYKEQYDYDNAMHFFRNALELHVRNKQLNRESSGYQQHDVTCYSSTETAASCNTDDSLSSTSTEVDDFVLVTEEDKEETHIALLHNGMGTIYKYEGEFDKALHSFKLALKIKRAIWNDLSDPATTDETAETADTTAAIDRKTRLGNAVEEMNGGNTTGTENHDKKDDTETNDSNLKTTIATDIARILNDIGNIYIAKGKVKPMMNAFIESTRMYSMAGMNGFDSLSVEIQLYGYDIVSPPASPLA